MTTKKEPQVRKPRAAKPAADPVSRERQLTSLAVDLAEKQLRDGSASPSVKQSNERFLRNKPT